VTTGTKPPLDSRGCIPQVGLVREHARDCHTPDCEWCELWRLYTTKDLRGLEEFVERVLEAA
jgi:hypothetical protein